MNGLRATVSELVQRWASFIVRQETRWRERLRSEGAQGEDVEDPLPKPEDKGCGTAPEQPTLLDEAAKRGGHVRHEERR